MGMNAGAFTEPGFVAWHVNLYVSDYRRPAALLQGQRSKKKMRPEGRIEGAARQ